jgi:hypothetical protein
MSDLAPVSFKKGRGHAPRLSAPYRPGRHSDKFWTLGEDAIIREAYPAGGAAACALRLEGRSRQAIYMRAKILGVRCASVNPRGAYAKPDDEIIRARWAELKGRGAVAALADELRVPRHWLSKRALELGLTMPHKKEPPWSDAEIALMAKAPLHDLKRASVFFAERGFARSPTAIGCRAKRLDLSRRAARSTYSSHAVAKLLGVDSKTVGAWILAGDIAAPRRPDQRLPQQGGSSFDIEPAELRRFILANLERIDLRKVEKFAFVALIAARAEETA